MKFLILLFIHIHYRLNSCGIRIKGLGCVQKRLKKEFVFIFKGKKVFYLPSIEGSYDYMLIGVSNEPETHRLLTKILPCLDTISFIDVGASVGEFVISVCNYPAVQDIYAFEPRPDCATVLRRNAELNNEKRIIVFENAVGNSEGHITFHLNNGGTSSGFFDQPKGSEKSLEVKCIRLDSVLPQVLENPILLIDTEGAEPMVMKGCNSFISKNRPLIIFEYNQTSKRHFAIEEIVNLLGPDYEIFRLKANGDLNKDFTNSWNCVAIPMKSKFSELLLPPIT